MFISPASLAGLIEYNINLNEWSVTGWNAPGISGDSFYAAMDNSADIINATGLSIGDTINGEFSWSGSIENMQLNYVANSIPEPISIALLSTAFIGIGLFRRKKAAQ